MGVEKLFFEVFEIAVIERKLSLKRAIRDSAALLQECDYLIHDLIQVHSVTDCIRERPGGIEVTKKYCLLNCDFLLSPSVVFIPSQTQKLQA